MELQVKEISTSEKELEITLNYDEVKNDIEAEVKKQSKSIQLPGFRKGKVPTAVLKRRFGDALEFEASEKVANTHFWKIADEKSLKPIGQPTMTDLKFQPGEDLHFKVKYEFVPEIDAVDYTDQEIEIPDFIVKDAEVEMEIKNIIRSNRTFEETEVVGDDNNFLLDVQLFRLNKDGEPENEKGEKIEIDLTNEGVNKEIIENSRGKKAGDNFTFGFDDERTIKNDEGEDEKVKEHFDYRVEINGIKKIILPELDSELIKKVTKEKVSTEEELRKQIKNDIQNYYNQKTEELLRGKIIKTIIENNEFTPPSTLVTNILEQLVKSEEEYLQKQRVPNVNVEELKERYKKTAENDVKWFLLKAEIQKKENISVTDDELNKMAEEEAEKTGISKDKLLGFYKSSDQNDKLLDKKLFDFLKEKNNIKKVDPETLQKGDSKE
ncbi:MAG: trigger factor [Ignavibacterium sp.]|nr:MAG: trigger factor [Ignavibacterium sp.]